MLSWPVIKVDRKLQHPNPGMAINSPDPSGIKVRATSPGKELITAGVFADSEESTECLLYNIKLRPQDQSQSLKISQVKF